MPVETWELAPTVGVIEMHTRYVYPPDYRPGTDDYQRVTATICGGSGRTVTR